MMDPEIVKRWQQRDNDMRLRDLWLNWSGVAAVGFIVLSAVTQTVPIILLSAISMFIGMVASIHYTR